MSPEKAPVLPGNSKLLAFIAFLFIVNADAYAQMREIYWGSLAQTGAVKKLDFYTPKEGFVAFSDGVGFTTDTAHSFISFTYISELNVDLVYWGINPGSKFSVYGVKAFNKNDLLVYGSYPNAPSILRSSDGGKNFTIVLASVNRAGTPLKSGVTDMVNLKDRSVTLAVDADNVYRSTSNGLTWDTLQVIPDAYFTNIDGYENGHIYAWSTTHPQQVIYKSGIDGSEFVPISVRGGTLRAASFINANEGYISVNGVPGPEVYYTRDAGESWMHTSIAGQPAIPFTQLKFVNAATGYGIANRNDTYQTTDSGHTWQKISRQNAIGLAGQDLTLSTISSFDGNQLWTGGESSLIELNTAMSKITPPPPPPPPVPIAVFRIDTTGLSATRLVKLISSSEPDLTLQWFVNDQLISTAGIVTFTPVAGKTTDTIKLVVFRGLLSDTAVQYQHYPVNNPPVDPPPVDPPPVDPPPVDPPPVDPPPVDPPPAVPAINKATPLSSPAGGTVDITGINFKNVISVTFGGIPAASYAIISESLIRAVVGGGATGNIEVKTSTGTASLDAFVFVQKPTITGFKPDSTAKNETIVIRGNNLATTSQVILGRTPALGFQVISDSEIHAITGDGSSGYVKIITGAGEDSLPGFIFNPGPLVYSVTPDRGIAGTPVTIKGEHFTGATAVSVGASNVSSFVVISDTVIVAIIPAGNNNYIIVTNKYGSAPGPYYSYPSVPLIKSFAPRVGGEGTRIKIEMDSYYYDIDSIKIGGVQIRERIPVGFQFEIVAGKGATGKISLHTADTTVFSSDSFEYVQKPVLKSFAPVTGKAGTVVTLRGSFFHRTARVYFGDAMAADVRVLSDSVLTAVVSSGASGEVRLETAGGKMAIPGFTFISSSIPKILSFSPVSGKAGTIVEIAGENFNTDPAANFVGFGAAYGKVVSATNSLIRVEAPAGASAELLTLTTNGFTSSSNNFFTLQSSDSRQVDDTTYKDLKTLIPARSFPGTNFGAHDLDGDGKPDLIVSGLFDLTVYLNTSNKDSVSFEQVLIIDNVSLFQNMLVYDIDGDGRQDLVAGLRSTIKFFKNTSTTGKISFDSPAERIGGTYSFFRAADINGDGKPEILGLEEHGDISIFRNTSSGSTISFGSRYTIPVDKDFFQFEAGDLDGDGKPEVLASISRSDVPDRSLLIYQNTSTIDTISFSPALVFHGGNNPTNFKLGDINRDNKTDLIINYSQGIQYTENTSVNGILSFARPINILTTDWTKNNDIGDLNGDGQIDLVVEQSSDSTLYIYLQNQVNNVVSFLPAAKAKTNSTIDDISIRDLNNNGSPEILFLGSDDHLHVFSADTLVKKADTCTLVVTINMGRDSLCTGNQLLFTATGGESFTNVTYQWFINGINTGVTGNMLRDPLFKSGDKVNVVITASTPCGVHSDTSKVIVIGPIVNAQYKVSITSSTNNVCDPSSKTFTAGQIMLVSTGTNSIATDSTKGIYRWKLNGLPAGDNAGILAMSNLKSGDEIWLEYTITSICKTETIISNKIYLSIINRLKAVATIEGDSEIKKGEEALMKTIIVNPGKSVLYQWQDSTNKHSWRSINNETSPSIRYQPDSSGVKLRSIILSTDSCGFTDTVITRPVIFTLTEGPAPLASIPIRAFPNPVGNMLSLNNINPADNWQSLELIGTDGQRFIIMNDIRNRTSINLSLAHIPKGLYLVVFKRSTGETTSVKIMKL
jgi:hypothetical protein